jgi:hypothetical protein
LLQFAGDEEEWFLKDTDNAFWGLMVAGFEDDARDTTLL